MSMDYERLVRQVDTLSQAVELLLEYNEDWLPSRERQILRSLREELYALRTNAEGLVGDETPGSFQPPLENVRLSEEPSKDQRRRRDDE